MMETLPKGPLTLQNLPEIISELQKAMSHSTLELRAPKNGVVSRLSNTCGKDKNVKPTTLPYNVAKLTGGHLWGYP
jgi:hypothetical protein